MIWDALLVNFVFWPDWLLFLVIRGLALCHPTAKPGETWCFPWSERVSMVLVCTLKESDTSPRPLSTESRPPEIGQFLVIDQSEAISGGRSKRTRKEIFRRPHFFLGSAWSWCLWKSEQNWRGELRKILASLWIRLISEIWSPESPEMPKCSFGTPFRKISCFRWIVGDQNVFTGD